MLIGTTIACSLGALVVAFVPARGDAWFFAPASAEELEEPSSQTLLKGDIQTMPVMETRVAMAFDQKAVDDRLDIHIDGSVALAADMGASGTLFDQIDVPTTDTISVYVVKSGDTLSQIAERFGVSQNTIRWANNMQKNSTIRVGQSLTILPITGVKHTVVKGDTIASIAKKYKADAGEIANYNYLGIGETLAVGATILIPDGEITLTQQATGAKTTAKVAGTGIKSGSAAPKGYYTRPITLTGNPRIRKTQGFHDAYNAVDVGAPIGTPVLAMADGTVIVTKSVSAWNGGYGGMIIVQHGNGSQTLYAHLSRITVSTGQRVSQGQKIGEVGSTGRSTGPHLHFEIRGVRPTPVLY